MKRCNVRRKQMSNSKVVVFDIDGTLANVDHRRHWVASKPKNWAAWNAAMHLDTVHDDIKWFNVDFAQNGHKIILCSGRGEEHRAVTVEWLNRNGIFYDDLYMRAKGDNRKDSVVKVELLDQIIVEHGRPYVWFDDRQQVVDAIRGQGIRVLQVAPGDF